ncbi:related to SLC1-1-acyl-sn-gylcerol-3-phosphate acyltransferase [Sporisorium reilianum f. sp. reilianum]|uniref:1-acyl-sn-glycerol-3-phosphate acyltransferase n=1 Tax=Sporisorium reilianum f. sp. reilianum TaxID=72559 RepID=A0A2N8UP35_9BASI|nr:related to SLC1-1-acyl-sn-gylcerol-3-phosphate acyltransferase [Sporisorium reilianum f. sp. reilianum]
MAVLSKSLSTLAAGALLLLALVSPRSQKLRFYLNSIIYLAGLGICSVWGIIVSLVMSLIPGQRLNINRVVARSFWRLTAPLVGVKFVVEGEEHFEHAKPAVVVGNHQTAMDILYLGRIFPSSASIMAKKELQYAPLLGQFMTLSGAVFINRKNLKDSIKAFQQIGKTMHNKKLSLWIFPEGTRSGLATPDLLPFKKGAFHLAIQAGVPVVPVVCENYNRLFDSKSRFESGTIHIKVLPPVPTTGLTADDANDLTEKVRSLMLAELRNMDERRQRADVAGVSADEAKMRGIAGFFARFVGSGKSWASVNRKVDRRERELREKGTSGEKPEDYHLVSEGQKKSS